MNNDKRTFQTQFCNEPSCLLLFTQPKSFDPDEEDQGEDPPIQPTQQEDIDPFSIEAKDQICKTYGCEFCLALRGSGWKELVLKQIEGFQVRKSTMELLASSSPYERLVARLRLDDDQGKANEVVAVFLRKHECRIFILYRNQTWREINLREDITVPAKLLLDLCD